MKEYGWVKTIVVPALGAIVGGFIGTIIGDMSFVPLTSSEWAPVGFLVGLLAPLISKKE